MLNPTGEVRRVADVILKRIVGDTYASGLRLPAEAALAEEFGCGRSTVREALRHLADLGLVRSRRGSGATVLDFRREGTPALLPAYLQSGKLDAPPALVARELMRLRTLMATEAVRMAARYAPAEALDEVRAHLERAPLLDNDPAAHALNELELYRALVIASGMWPAVWMVNAFWAPLRELNATFAPAVGPVGEDFCAHMERMLERVAAGDEQGAVAAVESWFKQMDERLAVVMETTLKVRDATQAPPERKP